MNESRMTILAPREYTLKELFYLFETQGKFDLSYSLITEKCLVKHIRFPALSKTAIEVYPESYFIVINLTKENRGKDLALSVLTDGWSDIMSSAKEKNAPLIGKIANEVQRLVNLNVDTPMALPDWVLREAEVGCGLADLEIRAFDDHLEFENLKKDKKTELPYNQIAQATVKNETLSIKEKSGRFEPYRFKSQDECAAWGDLIQSKTAEAESLIGQGVDETPKSEPPSPPSPPPPPPPPSPSAPPQPSQSAPPPPPLAPSQKPEELPEGVLKETEIYSGFSTLRLRAYDYCIELTNVKKGKTKVMYYNQMAKVVAKKDNIDINMNDGDYEPLVFKTKEECAAWDELIQGKL